MYEFVLLNTKEDILKNSWWTPLASIVLKKYIYCGRQWGPSTVWLQTFFKISSFVFNRRKKNRFTGLEQLEYNFLGELSL